MRKLFLIPTLALAVILTASASTEACHRGKGGGGAGGGCGASGGGQQAQSGCATCALVAHGDGYALVESATGRQLGYYNRALTVYTPYLGGDRWGAEVALTEQATRPAVGIAAK